MTTYYAPADSVTTAPVPPGPPAFPAGPPPAPPVPPVPPVPSGRRPRGRRGAITVTAAAALVVGAAAGLGIGHVAWSNAPVFEAAPAPSTTPGSGGGGLGGSGLGGSGGNGLGGGLGGSGFGGGGSNGLGGNGSDGSGGNPDGNGQSIFPPFLIPLLPGEGSGGSGSGSGGLGGVNGGPGGLGNSGGSGGLGGPGQQPGTITSAPGAPGDVSAIAAKVDPAVVDINVLFGYQQAAGAGTGIVLTSSGLVLTNNHVIDGATAIQATDQGNGKTYTATVVGYDPTSDVALLQLKGAAHLATATLGDSSTVTVGEPVVGIGNAEGVGGTPSAAGGSVTALDHDVSVGDDMYGTVTTLTGLIQINSDILPGDSGGPLVDSKGTVIGIDTAAAAGQATASSGFEGEAIPINRAKAIVATIESGHGTGSVHVGPTAALGLLMQGTEVGGVIPGGAAAAAGLQAGDRITSVGGHHVSFGQDLQHVMLGYHPGQSVKVGWVDPGGAAHHATATLGSGPAA